MQNIENMEDINQDTQEIEEVPPFDNSGEENNSATERHNSNPERTFTQEQVNEIIKNRLDREREKFDKVKSKILDEANFEESIIQREKAVTMREKKFALALELQADNLPLELADYVDYTDDTTIKKSYDGLKGLFTGKLQKSVEDTVQDRLKGTPPRRATAPLNDINSRIKDIFKE